MTRSSPPPVRAQPDPQQGGRPQRRRSRARTLLPLAVALWVVLEIWLLIVVAEVTSGFVVFLCIVAGFVLGAAAVKRAGRSAWRNLAATARQQGVPGAVEETAGMPAGGSRAGLHMLGGILLIVPGFLSDAIGLVLILPVTRRLTGRFLDRAVARRVGAAAADPGSLGDLFQQAREVDEQSRIHRPDGKVIRGEVVDRDGPDKSA